ncbi:MAG: hypothetical protein EGQ00_11950 [Parabacteroides johnsonii]|jgi:hypothetical protein|nr:hypothetical protein [Parabacteroides johnsonii]
MEETHKGKKKGLYGKSYPFCLSKQISDAQEEIRKRERQRISSFMIDGIMDCLFINDEEQIGDHNQQFTSCLV